MNINVKNLNAGELLVEIEGVIGVDERFQFDDNEDSARVSTFGKFRRAIENIAPEIKRIRVNIRSAGGAVEDALLIHSALTSLPDQIEVETHCYGFSASAATIIAQAASAGKRYVASSALYMIHNASTQFDGNAADAESVAAMLAKTDMQIAAIYADRSGLSCEHFINIMAKDNGRGEWLSAQQAVEVGLADVVERCSPLRNFVSEIRDFFSSVIGVRGPQISDNEDLSQANNRPLEALQTQTNAKNDPSIEHFSVNLTGNHSAYDRDAELFNAR